MSIKEKLPMLAFPLVIIRKYAQEFAEAVLEAIGGKE